jgi:hypothetical protein
MHWKLKSKIQNVISLLPPSLSYSTYYWIQRHFGGLRRTNPIKKLNAAIETCKRICEQGETLSNKVFLEVGTGRVPIVPIAYWLMGSEKTITIDLNPYLRSELVEESLQYISKNQEEVLNLFGSLMDKERFNDLLRLSSDSLFSLPRILDLCRIEYIAPGDATSTRLPDDSIDYHTSYTVFEHIPLEVLKRILKEGNRIIKSKGLFVHRIDYSDHFSHSDKRISSINLLQYSENQWERFAGNMYMYMNRLRHDDYINLFDSVGQNIIYNQPDTDQQLRELLSDGRFQLNERFSSKSKDVLVITGAWIVSQKKG